VIPERITVYHRIRVRSVNNVDHHHVPGRVPKTVQLGGEGRGEVGEGGVTWICQITLPPGRADVCVNVVPNHGHVTVGPSASTLPVEGIAAGQQ
jgi:hypothetical protein